MELVQDLFETLPFRVTSSRYFSLIMRRVATQWISVLALLLVAMIGATCYDLRFGIVLLMFIFIVLPMLLFFFYYNYALRREAFYSVVEKVAIIDSNGIDCVYDEQRRQVLAWSDVDRVEMNREAFLIFTGRYTYFYLRYDAFATIDELEAFRKILPQFMS